MLLAGMILLSSQLLGHLEALQGLRAAIHEDDLTTIIYSRNDREPKGVMLSHRNIVSNIKATITLIPIDYSKRAVSILPPEPYFRAHGLPFTYLVSALHIPSEPTGKMY